jgi:hypothetical protein
MLKSEIRSTAYCFEIKFNKSFHIPSNIPGDDRNQMQEGLLLEVDQLVLQ